MAALTLTPALWAYQSSETANLPSAPSQTQVSKDSDPVTVLPQHQWKRFWFSGQMNIIELNRGTVGFAPFTAVREASAARASMLHRESSQCIQRLGYRLRATWYSTSKRPAEAVSAIPMAGFTNIDVVRIPGEGSPLSTAPCLARATVRYVFPLSRDREEAEPGQQGVVTSLPVRRLEFHVGKFPLPDFLDGNAIGSDSHLQFMNWTVVNNGAWDYAADTRGYTVGVLADLDAPHWSLRFVEALMPKIANGIDFEWNLSRARAHNLELEVSPRLLANRSGRIRLLAYRNVADLGSYR